MNQTLFRPALCLGLVLSSASLLAGALDGDEHWDSGFNLPPGVNGEVYSTAVIGHDLYVSGAFTRAGDVEANGIARWDGGKWFALAPDGKKATLASLPGLSVRKDAKLGDIVVDKNGTIKAVFPNVKVEGHADKVLQALQS